MDYSDSDKSPEEIEAATRNKYLRQLYGPMKSYALWLPSDIDMETRDEWWSSFCEDLHENVHKDLCEHLRNRVVDQSS